MIKRTIHITCLQISLMMAALFFLSGRSSAQEQAASSEQEVESASEESSALRRRLEEQAAQIDRLRETLRQQSELIERHRRQMEDLQLKVEQLNVTASTTAAAAAAATTTREQEEEDAPLAVGALTSTPSSTLPAVPAQSERKNVGDASREIRFSGLIQGWFATGNGGFNDTFRLRRAELRFSGEISPKASWTVMIDAAKALSLNNYFKTIGGEQVLAETSVNQAGRILQDAYVTLRYFKSSQIDVGQFKVPLSYEGLQSSATLDTIERALFLSDRSRGGSFGDVRDIGMMFRGPLSKHADYQIGLFNGGGEGQNDVDKNDRKTFAGRLITRPPFINGLQLGASGMWGGATRPGRPSRNRMGAELLYSRSSLLVKSELMTGTDLGRHRLGYYVHFGYRLSPRVEAVVRLDNWDPDTRFDRDATDVSERDYLAGLNYYIKDNKLKLQVNYLRKSFVQGLMPRDVLLINLQTSW